MGGIRGVCPYRAGVSTPGPRARHGKPQRTGTVEVPLGSLHPARRAKVILAASVDVVHGLGYVAHLAPVTAASITLLATVLPLWLWGAALIVAGVLLVTPLRAVGASAGAVVWIVWGGCGVITLIEGVSSGWTFAPFLGMAVLHTITLWFYYCDVRDRRALAPPGT